MAAPTRWQLRLVRWFIIVNHSASFTFKLRITCPEVAGICKTTASVSAKVEGLTFGKKRKQRADSSKHLLLLPEGLYDFPNHGISERGIAELADKNGILCRKTENLGIKSNKKRFHGAVHLATQEISSVRLFFLRRTPKMSSINLRESEMLQSPPLFRSY